MLEAERCLRCKDAKCVEGCPVGVDIPGFVDRPGRGRPERRGRHPLRGQRPAGHLRPRLPAGDAVRGAVHPRQEGRAGGHRLPGALRGRLGPRAPAATSTSRRQPTGKAWPWSARPGRPDLRRRTGQDGPRGHHLRGPAHSPAACWSTASPSSACPRRSSTGRSRTSSASWASRSSATWSSGRPTPSTN